MPDQLRSVPVRKELARHGTPFNSFMAICSSAAGEEGQRRVRCLLRQRHGVMGACGAASTNHDSGGGASTLCHWRHCSLEMGKVRVLQFPRIKVDGVDVLARVVRAVWRVVVLHCMHM